MRVNFSYLLDQFSAPEAIFDDIRGLLRSGQYTLGPPVAEFESRFAALCQTEYAIGVNSGTDALTLAMKGLGVGRGDEVITTPQTFVATVGSIVATGATPVFVDACDDYNIDPDLIEVAITEKTKAIVPVYWAGNPPDMPRIVEIAKANNLRVVEDSCQGIGSSINGKPAGSFGDAAGFSLHPLKNINVWGDSGVIVTDSKALHDKLKLMRNHGMKTRDEIEVYGYNSRLDTLQAIVGNYMIGELDFINSTRIKNANAYDAAFADVPEITLPPRNSGVRHVYHLYIIQVQDRDNLLAYLQAREIEAKIHYPIPMHLQPASAYLGYKAGDFPVTEAQCKHIITLPAHQHLTEAQVAYTIETVRKFYGR